jgi:hypothetical protein
MLLKPEFTKSRVVGDSILRNPGEEHAEMNVECFPGIKTEQLHRMMELQELGNPETVTIDVGANDMEKEQCRRNVDFVKGELYVLVSPAKKKFSNWRLSLSGVLSCKNVSCRRNGALKVTLRRLE